jgi:serine/threonine protein kinase
MRSYHHPNVLTLLTSFIVGSDLYMVMPFCDGGSVLHIMKYKEKEVGSSTAAPGPAALSTGLCQPPATASSVSRLQTSPTATGGAGGGGGGGGPIISSQHASKTD